MTRRVVQLSWEGPALASWVYERTHRSNSSTKKTHTKVAGFAESGSVGIGGHFGVLKRTYATTFERPRSPNLQAENEMRRDKA
jgi:hypothetical protein